MCSQEEKKIKAFKMNFWESPFGAPSTSTSRHRCPELPLLAEDGPTACGGQTQDAREASKNSTQDRKAIANSTQKAEPTTTPALHMSAPCGSCISFFHSHSLARGSLTSSPYIPFLLPPAGPRLPHDSSSLGTRDNDDDDESSPMSTGAANTANVPPHAADATRTFPMSRPPTLVGRATAASVFRPVLKPAEPPHASTAPGIVTTKL